MLLKREVVSVAIVLASLALGASIVGHAQENPATDSTVPNESEKELKDAQDLKQKADALAEQQRKKEEASKANAPKEVFKPTEEISEDSPVPFPIDI